jgi:F420-dependent oxidoreductase-like protein
MRLSISVTNFSWPDAPRGIGPRVARIARMADQAAFDTLWAMDHLFQIGMNGPPDAEMLEVYTTLAYAAGQTERIRLGALVTAVPYRHPGVLVKTVTTLDVLSGGRAWLGIGAAWNDAESRSLGIPFPATAERYERLEETLRIARQMWAGDRTAFEGVHYQLAEPTNEPPALQSPRPPILIGGMGERKTLRLVAEYADACNLFDLPVSAGGPDLLAHKLDVLRSHCETAGRSYDEIEKTIATQMEISPDGRDGTSTPQEALDRFAGFAALGIDHVIVEGPRPWEEAPLERLAGLLPAAGRIVPAGR